MIPKVFDNSMTAGGFQTRAAAAVGAAITFLIEQQRQGPGRTSPYIGYLNRISVDSGG